MEEATKSWGINYIFFFGAFKKLVRCNRAATTVGYSIGGLGKHSLAAATALRSAAEEKSYSLLLRLLAIGIPGVRTCVCCLRTCVGCL